MAAMPVGSAHPRMISQPNAVAAVACGPEKSNARVMPNVR
jgi:hypothetical protein